MYGNFYQIARWAYQPLKQAKLMAVELGAIKSRSPKITGYLAKTGFKGLQIGSGPHQRPGWLNSDVPGTSGAEIGLDITKPLPFPTESLDAIYGSEVIEHIPMDSVVPFLREARRILRVGGVLRLTTPDVVEVCRIAIGLNEECGMEAIASTWLEEKILTRDVWINAMFRRWGHQHLWDFESMKGAMQEAGFASVERLQPQITGSKFPELANQETRYGMPPPPHCWASSMILEATK